MKKLTYLLLVLLPMMATGQTPTPTQNYIKTTAYKVSSSSAIASPTPAQATTSVTYFDGLGRPVQQLGYQQSASGMDIVTPIEYDAFGKQSKDYLPYTSSQNNAAYITPSTLLANQKSQYQINFGIVNDNPYSEKVIEASPLNRVLQQAAPGNPWSLSNNHTVKLEYKANVANEVKLYHVRKEL